MVLVVKNPPTNTGDTRDASLIPGSGRSLGGGNGHPLQYSCLENPMDRGAWQATVRGVAESDTTEMTYTRIISGFLFYWGFWCLTLLQLVLREHVCSLEMNITVSLSLSVPCSAPGRYQESLGAHSLRLLLQFRQLDISFSFLEISNMHCNC